VKRLFGVGSLKANKKIYDLEYDDIYKSIFSMKTAKEQGAWVWLLAFIYSMNEREVMKN